MSLTPFYFVRFEPNDPVEQDELLQYSTGMFFFNKNGSPIRIDVASECAVVRFFDFVRSLRQIALGQPKWASLQCDELSSSIKVTNSEQGILLFGGISTTPIGWPNWGEADKFINLEPEMASQMDGQSYRVQSIFRLDPTYLSDSISKLEQFAADLSNSFELPSFKPEI